MPVRIHYQTVRDHHEIRIAVDPIYDPVTQVWIDQRAIVRAPTRADFDALRDSDVYDIVAIARGVSRSEVAFERFTFERTGRAIVPDPRAVRFWRALHQGGRGQPYDAHNGTSLIPFAESSAAMTAARNLLGEKLADDYMRATCRSFDDEREALLVDAIRLIHLLAN